MGKLKKKNRVKMINTKTVDTPVMEKREDIVLLNQVDNIFRKRRGYVVQLPKPNEPVLACMSGGLDSCTNIIILLEELGVQVYPFFIKRGQSNYKWEKKAVDFYDKYFAQRYPRLYHKCIEIELDVPGRIYKKDLIATKCLEDYPEVRKRATYPARNPIIFLVGMEYGYSLQHKGILAKTMFGALHTEDWAYHSSLTSLRCQNLLMCNITGDWSWQFISIPTERELGNYYGKARMVKYADECGMPLEHTVSCTNKQDIQCGLCTMACMDRRLAFKKAGVEDKTKYEHPFPKDSSGWVLTK